MSTALVAAVACAMASLNGAIEGQLDASVGTAHVRVQPAGRDTMPDRAMTIIEGWEGVRHAEPRLESSLALVAKLPTLVERPDGTWSSEERAYRVNAFVTGVDLATYAATAPRLVAGRLPNAPGETLLDASLASRLTPDYAARLHAGEAPDVFADPAAYLSLEPVGDADTAPTAEQAQRRNRGVGVRPGEMVGVVRMFRERGELRVVGIAEASPLGGKPFAVVSLETLGELAGTPGQVSSIDLTLEDNVDAAAFAEAHKDDLGRNVLVQTTERITAGIEKNLAASQMGLILVGAVALLCSSFIIMTGLTTGVAEQQRTLAVLRCLGAERSQLATAQLLAGLLVGGIGAAVGVPVGIGLAWMLSVVFERQMPEGLALPPVMLTVVLLGSLGAGLLGAFWPAWRAASMSPLGALAARATPATTKGIIKVGLAALLMIATMASIVLLVHDSQAFFWSYVFVGLPAMFIGYFLLSVPLVTVVAWLFAPAVARVLRIPPALLARTVRATPYRHGFTAGSLMTGLALMIGIWTNGGSALKDWITKIKFPDAFAYGLPLSEETPAVIAQVPGVARTTPITMLNVEIDGLGVEGMQQYKTAFFGLEYGVISDMFEVEFVQGDPETAAERMRQGGAVLVAREFTAAKGLGLGDAFVCRYRDEEHTFEIAGVVTSAGLEFISQFFDFGDSFVNQTMHSVVGSRSDVAERFGVTKPYIVGIELDPDADDTEAVARIREATIGMGVLNVGSGRQIRAQFESVFKGTLTIVSTIAVGAMLVACFGVANLIIAEVQSRRFELGVIRSVGGSRGQLVRLVCGQAIIIALGACVLGTLLGIQAAWGGRAMNERLYGLVLSPHLPYRAIAWAWGIATLMTLASAAPSAWRVARAKPRVLLSAR